MVDRSDMLNAAAIALPTFTGFWRSFCPFCEEESGEVENRNLSIRMATGDYWCWACGRKGFIPRISEALFAKVEQAKAQEVAVSLDQGPTGEPFPPPEGFTPLGYGYGADSLKYLQARRYLQGRGVDDVAVQECEIGATLSGKYWKSIVVPIIDRGVWRGYVCRRYDRKVYLYPPGMERGAVFFNMDVLLEESDEPVFLVEGCFDALPHYPFAVACLGKPSGQHVDRLRSLKRPIAIVLDADAQLHGWTLAEDLKLHGVRAGFVKLPAGTDPGDADSDWLLDAVYEAVDV